MCGLQKCSTFNEETNSTLKEMEFVFRTVYIPVVADLRPVGHTP